MVAASAAPILTASQLFALSQGSKCQGELKCHWCGAPCERRQDKRHDDHPPAIANRNWNKNLAAFPHEGYQCQGCWLWRRPSITTSYLTLNKPDALHKHEWRVQKDRQSAVKYSWLITDSWAYAVGWDDRNELYKFLLSPPKRFVLSLLDAGEDNQIHLAKMNNHQNDIIRATEHSFTVNNIPHVYTVLGLETALRGGNTESSGVRALLKLFGGEYAGLVPLTDEENTQGRGPRSAAENRAKKKV